MFRKNTILCQTQLGYFIIHYKIHKSEYLIFFKRHVWDKTKTVVTKNLFKFHSKICKNATDDHKCDSMIQLENFFLIPTVKLESIVLRRFFHNLHLVHGKNPLQPLSLTYTQIPL